MALKRTDKITLLVVLGLAALIGVVAALSSIAFNPSDSNALASPEDIRAQAAKITFVQKQTGAVAGHGEIIAWRGTIADAYPGFLKINVRSGDPIWRQYTTVWVPTTKTLFWDRGDKVLVVGAIDAAFIHSSKGGLEVQMSPDARVEYRY